MSRGRKFHRAGARLKIHFSLELPFEHPPLMVSDEGLNLQSVMYGKDSIGDVSPGTLVPSRLMLYISKVLSCLEGIVNGVQWHGGYHWKHQALLYLMIAHMLLHPHS